MTLDTDAALRELLYAHRNHAEFQAGSAEPWIANLLAALVVANDTHTAIEIGCFQGFSSVHIVRALAQLPHPTTFIGCEIDPARASDVDAAIYREIFDNTAVSARVVCDDSLRWIPTLAPASVDFAWIDGNHEKAHVAQELTLLWPKMRVNGLICLHDVFGVCDLQAVVKQFPNSVSLDLPRLGPAGGLGLIQVR